MIGRFRLVDRLGEGGFGVAWRAEQTEPVRREVALKVIKPGMDSAAVLAWFEAERQASAVMHHPCIARVLDGGATDRGLPYFVMELVKGLPITEFCDGQRLSSAERLGLFRRVCGAIEGLRRVLGAEQQSTLNSMNIMGMLFESEGRLDEAEGLYREAYAEAEPLAIKCEARNRARCGPGHAMTRDAVGRLVALYDAWQAAEPDAGHNTEAERWRAELSATKPEPDEASPAADPAAG